MFDQIKLNSSVKVVYHGASNDRVNDNGQFKSLEGTVVEIKDCAAGKQYIMQTMKGTRSFTTAAKVRSLIVDNQQVVKDYANA